jgi:hypothetical protein
MQHNTELRTPSTTKSAIVDALTSEAQSIMASVMKDCECSFQVRCTYPNLFTHQSSDPVNPTKQPSHMSQKAGRVEKPNGPQQKKMTKTQKQIAYKKRRQGKICNKRRTEEEQTLRTNDSSALLDHCLEMNLCHYLSGDQVRMIEVDFNL